MRWNLEAQLWVDSIDDRWVARELDSSVLWVGVLAKQRKYARRLETDLTWQTHSKDQATLSPRGYGSQTC